MKETKETYAIMVLPEENKIEAYTYANAKTLLEKVAEEVENFNYDVSTEKGKQLIKSFAYKISRAKTAVAKMADELKAPLQVDIKKINEEKSKIVDAFQALQDKAKSQVTELEKKEEARIKGHRDAIEVIENLANEVITNWQDCSLSNFEDATKQINADSRDWENFKAKATNVKLESLRIVQEKLQERLKRDAEQKELADLRRKNEEFEKFRREQEIIRITKEETEKKARAEIDALQFKAEQERLQREEDARIVEEQRLQAIKDEELKRAKEEEQRKMAQARAEKEAREKIEALERKALADKIEREEELQRLENERLKAIQDEIDKQERQLKEKRLAEKKAQEDKELNLKVEGEIAKYIISIVSDLKEVDAILLAKSLKASKAPYLTFNYNKGK